MAEVPTPTLTDKIQVHVHIHVSAIVTCTLKLFLLSFGLHVHVGKTTQCVNWCGYIDLFDTLVYTQECSCLFQLS